MYIKKRGKAKSKAADPPPSDAAPAGSAGGGGGGGSDHKGSGGVMQHEDDFDHRLGNYQLMEAIGKGGYGTVYRGLNIERGMTVAVKRVNLQGIPHEELESIEMEIRLLQNLAHPNIVKYLDSIRSDDYLNIILEYVENGSLSSLLVKFGGMFPEQLCSHYITQVLKGLQYLHQQGVIHRDIKGANILSTKEGQVKLADFGVATKLNESRKMAPEIIEMTGQQSSACDIWSVGCTCVELLTGKPPYFDLQQMPALFRIVQDEHPPLPDGISPACEDFLMNCFQKDPNRRIDANGLLKHPWLKKSVEMMEVEEMKKKILEEQLLGTAAKKQVGFADSPDKKSVRKSAAPISSSDTEDWDLDDEGEDAIDLDQVNVSTKKSNKLTKKKPGHKYNQSTAAFPLDRKRVPPTQQPQGTTHTQSIREEEEEDEELVIKLRNPSEEDEDPFADFSDEGGEDGFPDDEDEEDEDEDAETVVAKTSMKTIRPTQVVPPTAVASAVANKSNGGATSPGVAVAPPPNNNLASASSLTSSLTSTSGSMAGPSLNLSAAAAPTLRKLEAFVENDEEEIEDYTELEQDLELKSASAAVKSVGVPGVAVAVPPAAAGHKSSKSMAAGMGGHLSHALTSSPPDLAALAEDDEADPFDDITFDEDVDDGSAQEDVLLTRSFLRILEQLSPQNDEKSILEACDKLHEMGSKHSDLIRTLMTNHGVIPLMEMLEVSNAHILHAILKLINQIVGKNIKFQQNMSLVGLIPAIIRFGGEEFPREIRMEAASFVRQFCYASDWTRKMFIACDGLPVLVSFLKEEYEQSKTLVWNSIDCIRHVFDITSNPKNDFCRLFCKFGLLEPLTRSLTAIQADTESTDAPDYVLKIAKILHLFSQGDKVVKNHFAKPSVIKSMLQVLSKLPQEILILLLKSIRNISMDSTTLDLLEAAGAIPALVPFLDASQVSENQHQVLLTMYYLCQIKPSRQEQAALSGIIPHLQRFIRIDHPLKQFAYPIIFLLAKTSAKTRAELKKHGGIQFYMDILTSSDVYWRSHALEVVSSWLSVSVEEGARVSFLINTPSNINKLLKVFRDTQDNTQFDMMLPSFRKIFANSVKINQSMGRGKEFVQEIRNRLDRHSSSNNIRINLLKILSLLFAAHPNPAQLAAEADLLPVLHRLLEDKSAVLVVSLTHKLLTQYLGEENEAATE